MAVTRARGRRRLRVAIAVATTVALAAGTVALLFSGLFSARHVTVRGSLHTPAPVVLATAGLDASPPLVEVDPGAAAARLERLPWVARATVVRRWPDSVTVTVVERVPVAAVDRRGGVALVDASGRVLAWPAAAPAGLPLLAAPVGVGRPGSTLGAGARPGLTVAAALPPALARRVQGVDVGRDGTVTLDLGSGLRAELGAPSTLGAKLEALASVLAGAQPHGPALIDVTVPDEPLVGAAPGPAPPAAAGGSSGTHSP
ncbi:MAG TPA: FtsQ-type POTRA domain-containing protein [Acidimicrobiales bacterium]|nr:FtsQ-type POTRA domain-containing protein [Acidimicrobiales bacterium]